jgi:hypothetical protein
VAARRYPPYAFTEQGVAMLSTVLESKRAVLVNVEIMRTFVRLRRVLAAHEDLPRKLDALEGSYDAQLKIVLDPIRELKSSSFASHFLLVFGKCRQIRLPRIRMGGRRNRVLDNGSENVR